MIRFNLLCIILLLFTNTLSSQDFDKSDKKIVIEETGETLVITYREYLSRIKSLDKSSIEDFGAARNQMVTGILEYSYRQYRVTYMDYFSQKLTQGTYNGKKHNWDTWEEYVKRRIRWRKEEIEDEKRKIIAQKKFKKKEKERKRLAKIEAEKKKRKDFREEMVKGFDRYKYIDTFFGGKNLDVEFYDFEINKKFSLNSDFSTDEIEEIGTIILKLGDETYGSLFKITIGVNNLFDDVKFKYFVDGEETDFDFGIREIIKGRKNGSTWWINDSLYDKLRTGFDQFKYNFENPFVYNNDNFSLTNFFQEYKEGILYTKEQEKIAHQKNKYNGVKKELINGFIAKKIKTLLKGVPWNMISCSVTEIIDKKKYFYWTIKTYDNQVLLNSTSYKLNKKKMIIESESRFKTMYEDYVVRQMLDGNYEYADVMNN